MQTRVRARFPLPLPLPPQVIRWYARSQPDFKSIILRYFNVYGSDPQGRLGACVYVRQCGVGGGGGVGGWGGGVG